jgi:type II secretory pathway component GspD/PulD (secretin)
MQKTIPKFYNLSPVIRVAVILTICVLFYSADAQAQEETQEATIEVQESSETDTGTTGLTNQSEEGFEPYVPDDQSIQPGARGLDERISLDLRNIEAAEALRFLAMKGGLNMAVSPTVSGRLFLLLNDVPIRDVFDIILRTNSLAYDKQGEIYNIMTEVEYKQHYGRKFSDFRKVKIFQLKYAIPERVFSAIDALKSELGRVLVDQESGMVLVMDTPEMLEKMDRAISTLEQKRDVKVYSLQYAKAKDIEENLKAYLDAKGAGSIISSERGNQVIVQTFPERMEQMDALVKSLDQKTKQVLIVAKIIKITLSDDLEAEIQWEGLFKNVPIFAFDKENPGGFIGNHPFAALARTQTSAGLRQSFIDDFVNIAPTVQPTPGAKSTLSEGVFIGQQGGDDSFEVFLKFLKTIGETRVLSSPRITVLNNQEAKIHVGEKQAYVTTTTTTGQSTNTTAEEVTFVDVGIELSVTPTINDEGYISMKIKPEISSVASSLITPTGNQIPIIDTSEAETSVIVKDKTTIVIAGLRRDDFTETTKKVPYLSNIPLFGNLFTSGIKGKGRTEVLILLTPHLIDGDVFFTGEPGQVRREPGLKSYQPYTPAKAAIQNAEWFKS